MLAIIPSATLVGIEGHPVKVEVHIAQGLPAFSVVGLPDAACREARDRVRAAFSSTRLEFPKTRITVNLAPSAVRKVGAGLDLAIAVAILTAQGRVDAGLARGCAYFGELGLDGSIRPVPGLLSLVDAVHAPAVVVPVDGFAEASLVGGGLVRGVRSLGEVVAALDGTAPWPADPAVPGPVAAEQPLDLREVRGQPLARWAVEVAAAGCHHLLMIGPPGAGKTMLASRLPGVLPPLGRREALEVTRIHSAAGEALPEGGLITVPPFRAPHHSATMVSLVGGGSSRLKPGEISLAHDGVLFLDEIAEFSVPVLDALRQPLEEGVVRVSRARQTISFPARFLLVAAMNPCACGDGGPFTACQCSEGERTRYARRVSGPLLDRFDLRVLVSRPDVRELLCDRDGSAEPSAVVAARVAAARAMAGERGVRCNADLRGSALRRFARLSAGATRLVEHRLRSGRLSARGLDRVTCVARTISDLDGEAGGVLDERAVAAALELRADVAVLERAS